MVLGTGLPPRISGEALGGALEVSSYLMFWRTPQTSGLTELRETMALSVSQISRHRKINRGKAATSKVRTTLNGVNSD